MIDLHFCLSAYTKNSDATHDQKKIALITEASPMSDPELMAALFEGSDLAHGRSEMTREITAKGKHEAKSWTEKRPATVEDWARHLRAEGGIGIPPLNSKNMVRWGAIDVDVYNGLSLEALNAKIQEAKLPLVLCRSKSGGPHMYLFVNDWVPAKMMIEKLDAMAGFLGFGTSEIFPKQEMIAHNDKNPDFGSWINMPYYGGTRFLRYGLDQESKALGSVPAFVEFVRSRTMTVDTFKAFEPPTPKEILPDGPPCLNQLMAARPTENRNIILSNIAVYAKKAYPENWKEKLDEYNRQFPEPLGSTELEALKKSYDKKDYRYQCSKSPLCNYCDSSRCRKTKHGVGGGEFLPSTRSLSMVDTTPPIWYLDIVMPNETSARISLNTEELQNPRLFQRRCMETLQKMPPSMKMDQWEPIVARLMQHCTKIEVPPEMSPIGQFKEYFEEFLINRSQSNTMEDLLRGIPFKSATHYSFRLRDLTAYLSQNKFTALKQNEIFAVMKNDYKANKKASAIAGRFVRYFEIPIPNHEQPNNPEPIKPAEFVAAY